MGKKLIKDYEFPLVTYLHHWGIESIEEYEELYNVYSNQLYKEGRTKTKKEKVIDVGINEDDLIVYPYYLDSYLKKKGESECASHTDIDLRSYTSTEKSPHLRSGHVRHLSNGREVEVSSCVIHKDKYKKPFNVAYELK